MFYDSGGSCVSIVLLYIIIVTGCITLGQTNKSSAGCYKPQSPGT